MTFLQTCIESGCSNLVYSGRCRVHAIDEDRRIKENSPWRWVYADRRWKSLRRQVKREQLLCIVDDCYEVWTVLDHVVALQDGGEPFDRGNVQGMCKHHHDQKTADEVNSRRKS